MTAPIIETNALTRSFGELTAVDKMTISVQPGETFGLLGPNGAGKTTAIKMLITLLPPTSGDASVAGYSILSRAGDVRRMIGYVPQMLSTEGTLTGYENLLIFARLYDIPRGERKTRIHNALKFMGLEEESDRLVRTYSGGMVRRLEIAQSILHHPPVLFLDEPTVGLDPLARKAVWGHIEQLRIEYGTTILMTTHLMEEADSMCNRVAIMHRGKVIVTGKPDDLKVSIGREGTTLEDVFIYHTGSELGSGGSYRDVSRTRRTARRLG
jgi:ABC-2 type transport system ATP-binding protein